MEIIDERTKNRKTLEYLDSGTMFLDNEGDVCMVTDDTATIRDIKCVSLKDGATFEEWKTAKVEVVTGKLYLED